LLGCLSRTRGCPGLNQGKRQRRANDNEEKTHKRTKGKGDPKAHPIAYYCDMGGTNGKGGCGAFPFLRPTAFRTRSIPTPTTRSQSQPDSKEDYERMHSPSQDDKRTTTPPAHPKGILSNFINGMRFRQKSRANRSPPFGEGVYSKKHQSRASTGWG
jgi:hypothetical protein